MKLISPSFCRFMLIATLGLLQSCGESSAPANPADIAAQTPEADAARITALRTQLAMLEQQAQRVKDANDIKRLQRAYGYYVEEALWDEVINLFTDNATLEMARDGVYIGKEHIRAYFYALGDGQQGLREGQLNEQLQLMPVVTLSDDGQSAKARWRNLMLLGQLGENALWGEGPFENEYVKEDGVLAREVAQFQTEIANLEAENDIENLQRIYGFYIDKNQWTQAADLFTENGSFETGGEGAYVGKAHILAYLQSKGAEGPQQGILNDQMQLQPVVHVYPDGTAKGRWHHFAQEAVAGVSHHWGTGIYENEYVFEDGVWKISKLRLYTTMRTPYEDGWGVTALPRTAG